MRFAESTRNILASGMALVAKSVISAAIRAQNMFFGKRHVPNGGSFGRGSEPSLPRAKEAAPYVHIVSLKENSISIDGIKRDIASLTIEA